MPSQLRRALNILEVDERPVLVLGALHFVVAVAHALFDIGITSLLIAHLGAEALPQVYVGSALLLIFASVFVIPVIDRLSRFKLFAMTLVFFAVVLVFSHQGASAAGLGLGLVYRGLYLLCYLMKSLVFLQFWLIAGEVCDIRQAKRLFPILLGFSLIGGVTASIAAAVLLRWVSTADLLLIAGLFVIAALVPTWIAASQYATRLERPKLRSKFKVSDALHQLRTDMRISLSSPLLRSIAASVLLFGLLAQVLDFLMGKAASVRYTDPEALTSFYALLNGTVIGAGALVQFLFASRWLSSIGVTRAQLAAPVVLIAAFTSITVGLIATGNELGAVFFFVVLVSRVIQKTLRISIYRTSTDLVFNPIPPDRRGRAKAFKETLIEPAGALIAGLFIMATGAFELKTLVIASLVLSGVFLGFSLRLHAGYLESLVGTLREKSRFQFAFHASEEARAPALVTHTRNMADLEKVLSDDDGSVRLLGVEVAAELRDPAAASLLASGFPRETDDWVRATMVAALGRLLRRADDSMKMLESSLEDQDPRVRANGIEAIAQLGLADCFSLLPAFEQDPEARIRANTAVAYSRLDPDAGAEQGRGILEDMYRGEDESAQQSALHGLGEIGDRGSIELLDEALADESMAVKRQAILSLSQAGRREALDRLVVFMEDGDGATQRLASRALADSGDAAVDPLILTLWSSNAEVRRHAADALGRIGSARARQALTQILSLEAEEAYYDLMRLQRLDMLPQVPGIELLSQALVERVARSRGNALHVLEAAFGDRPGMRLILGNLSHPDPSMRANAVEALEVKIEPQLLGGVQPLFEHSDLSVIAEHGASLYPLPDKKPLEALFELARDRSRWVRACALFALGEVGGTNAIRVLESQITDPYELVRLNAIEGLGRLASAGSLVLLQKIAGEQTGRTRQYAAAAIERILSRTDLAIE